MADTFPINKLIGAADDSPAEQGRTRAIFEVLKAKAIKEEYLSEHEKEFFCTRVELSLLDDGKWEDYKCCENPRFKYRYLIYYTDLSGGGPYTDIKGTTEYRVPPEQSQRELAYLYEKAEEWEVIINDTRHHEELLQQSCKEAREDLKNLDNSPEVKWGLVRKGSFLYKNKRIGILLRSRYIYCKALEIFEALSPEDFILNLNEETIELNEYSLIHIVSRHFAGVTQQYNTGKSYHTEDIVPWKMALQLKDILNRIDKNGTYKGMTIDKVAICFKDEIYLIWTEIKKKAIKGKGNVEYRRLQTFYPVKDALELRKLNADYSMVQIDDELSIYIPKA